MDVDRAHLEAWLAQYFGLALGDGEFKMRCSDLNEGGPPGCFAPSASPLVVPHVVARLSQAITSDSKTPADEQPHLSALALAKLAALDEPGITVHHR